MSLKNLLIVLFWGFVIFMLGSQLWNESKKDAEVPSFHQVPLVAPAVVAQVTSAEADVRQIHYDTKDVSYLQFEASVTLKNVGQATAANVEIFVRPFRGGANSDNPGMDSEVPEESLDSQFGEWLSFPDLAPGEEKTEVIDFQNKKTQGIDPGYNLKPNIVFTTKKT